MANFSYDSVAAARTRAAAEILSNSTLKGLFLAAGGAESDLEEIRQHGETAHALNTTQSSAAASGVHATLGIANAFVALQGEYSAVMAVVQAAVGQMQRAGVSAEMVTQLQAILKNEVPVTIREVEIAGEKKKKAARSQSNEAMRAEIEKDASALVGLTAAHAALAARGVKLPRLRALATAAKQLSGKLSDRAVKKGTAKAATADEHKAVAAQRAVWGATYRVLRKAAENSESLRNLLSEAAR